LIYIAPFIFEEKRKKPEASKELRNSLVEKRNYPEILHRLDEGVNIKLFFSANSHKEVGG